jgi:hypothetical protein
MSHLQYTQYIVSCDGCDFRHYPWAADAEEAIWECGVGKTAKCPKCGGQLKATPSASTPEPISPGTMVRTTRPNMDKRNEWTDESWWSRLWGVEGSVITHHDSHGFCYDVRHPDGSQGCYDPTEIEVVAKSK